MIRATVLLLFVASILYDQGHPQPKLPGKT
jgi:hypothetical protein